MVRVLAVVAALVLAGGAPPWASGANPGPDSIELTNMPDRFVDMVDWSVSLFKDAELELPPMRFAHHADSKEPCGGAPGLHRVVEGVSSIEVCTTEATFPAQVMILHEIAHAWIAHNLSPTRKEIFRELRGWEHWNNHTTAAWHENGSEQAAEIMVWGLVDRPIPMLRIADADCDALDAGYRALTQAAPTTGYRDYC